VSLVHSASFSLVRRTANFLHYGSLDSSIFQTFLGTAEIARFMRISISPGHSGRLRPVRHKTSFLRHEWCENLTPRKVPEAFIPPVLHDSYAFCTFCKFESLTTPNKCSPWWVTWELNFSESAGDNSYFLFYNDIDVSCSFCKFRFCRMRNLFQDHFNLLSSFFKF